MKTTGIARIFPGNVRAAFDGVSPAAFGEAVVAPTPDARELVWRQRLIQRDARVSLIARSAKAKIIGMGVRQFMPWSNT